MGITPKEIRNQQFGMKFRGFDIEEVDHFLEQIAGELELLLTESNNFKEEIKKKDIELNNLRSKETELQNSVMTAHKTKEELISSAKQKAETMVNEAGKKAAEIIKNAQDLIEPLRQQKERLQKELRQVINGHLAVLGMEIKIENKSPGESGTGTDSKSTVSKKDTPAKKIDIFELDLDGEYDGKLEINLPKRTKEDKYK